MKKTELEWWDEVLSAASRLQGIIHEAVLVGGTASAIYTEHRISFDADHVIPNVKETFDDILAALESVAGRQTARMKRPILGSLDGIETGIRQLMRTTPLEVQEVNVQGHKILCPTPQELLRIKAVLILKRNATRDYIDFVALSDSLGFQNTYNAFETFDILYPQNNNASALQQLLVQLGKPLPFDLQDTNLGNYKYLNSKWISWDALVAHCQHVAKNLMSSIE
ncbi:MAG: hypothetical protein LBS65_00805 [Desulfovibrio sp.]|nr:hypothetical protein [Desulfovibrio sp.]